MKEKKERERYINREEKGEKERIKARTTNSSII